MLRNIQVMGLAALTFLQFLFRDRGGAQENAMRVNLRMRAANIVILVLATFLVGFAGVRRALAQEELPPPRPLPAGKPSRFDLLGESVSTYQVFPEGGFPSGPPSAE